MFSLLGKILITTTFSLAASLQVKAEALSCKAILRVPVTHKTSLMREVESYLRGMSLIAETHFMMEEVLVERDDKTISIRIVKKDNLVSPSIMRFYREDYERDLLGFRYLQRMDREGTLAGFKVPEIYSNSRARGSIHLAYVHGFSISEIYTFTQGSSADEFDIISVPDEYLFMLQRFNDYANKTLMNWERTISNIDDYYIDINYIKTESGVKLVSSLEISRVDDGTQIMAIDHVNTFYEPRTDSLALIDPF